MTVSLCIPACTPESFDGQGADSLNPPPRTPILLRQEGEGRREISEPRMDLRMLAKHGRRSDDVLEQINHVVEQGWPVVVRGG